MTSSTKYLYTKFKSSNVFMPDSSLASALDGHRNSFGFLRLVFAFLVIVSHTYPLGGFGADPLFTYFGAQDSLGGIAVTGFFALSGFLIVRSGRFIDVMQFLWHRVLRIFPGYWVALLVGALVVGPLVWWVDGGSLSEYLTRAPGSAYSYLKLNADLNIRQYGILNIFATTTPYGELVKGSVLNGSLWTLIYEWGCYLLVAGLVVFGVLKRSRFVVLVIALFFLVMQILQIASPETPAIFFSVFQDQYRISLGFVFMIGATLGIYAEKIPFDFNLGIFTGFISILTLLKGGWSTLGYIAFAYFVLWLGAALPKYFQRVGSKNDYSYGIYIYGFLVQQFTAYLGWYKWGVVPWVITSCVMSFGLAWLSWHLIEKQAMKLKKVGPGKGFSFWISKIENSFDKKRNQTT